MRRSRGGAASKESAASIQPSTPLNQNSNSCSMDTMCSSAGQLTMSSNANAIVHHETKIRNLLKELQANVVRCQVQSYF